MTTPWNSMSKDEKQATTALFDALSVMDALDGHGNGAEKKRKPVGFTDLYEYAHNPNGIMSAALGSALIHNASLRRDLDQLIDRMSVYHFPKAAAASSGALESREGSGYKIRLKASRADEGQLYVIIEISNLDEPQPESLIVKLEDGRYIKQTLPEGINGTYQLLLETNADMVVALRDIKTEVFLL